MLEIVEARKDEYPAIMELWEASVRQTHDFLDEEDIRFFRSLILNECLDAVELRCAKDAGGRICGFLGVAAGSVEMLFVHPSCRGVGVGKLLLSYAMGELNAWKLDVNEQNPDARGFYEHMGFRVIGRSPQDGFGKPFPLLHMEYGR